MAKPSKSYSKGLPPHLKLDKVKAELKHGYCETCEIKYSDIDKVSYTLAYSDKKINTIVSPKYMT